MADRRMEAGLEGKISVLVAHRGKPHVLASREYHGSVDRVGRSLGIRGVEPGMYRGHDLCSHAGMEVGCSGGLGTIWRAG